MIVRFMLMLCGFTVCVKNEEHRRNTCPVVICNYISPVDRIMFSLIQPNIMANEWGLPAFLSKLLGLQDLNAESSRETFVQNARTLCQATQMPLFTRPEGAPTSGKHALLKFSSWQFSISESVQPVVVTAKRPMPIALTTLTSTGLSDIFYFVFSPYTLFTVTYLPVEVRADDDSPEMFSERVREKMAAALEISSSKYSRHDRNDLLKKLSYGATPPRSHSSESLVSQGERGGERSIESTTAAKPVRSTSQMLSPNLEAMVQYCKEIVPQVPLDVLRAEISRTQDASGTLSNIFEGNIHYEPEPEVRTPPSHPSPAVFGRQEPGLQPPAYSATSDSSDIPRSGSTQTYAADVFSKLSGQRELSLAERKKVMLMEARLRYIKINGLSITLQQIESGQF